MKHANKQTHAVMFGDAGNSGFAISMPRAYYDAPDDIPGGVPEDFDDVGDLEVGDEDEVVVDDGFWDDTEDEDESAGDNKPDVMTSEQVNEQVRNIIGQYDIMQGIDEEAFTQALQTGDARAMGDQIRSMFTNFGTQMFGTMAQVMQQQQQRTLQAANEQASSLYTEGQEINDLRAAIPAMSESRNVSSVAMATYRRARRRGDAPDVAIKKTKAHLRELGGGVGRQSGQTRKKPQTAQDIGARLFGARPKR